MTQVATATAAATTATMRDNARTPAVSITALVTREVGAAVRASSGTASPYLAHGRLHRELDRLHDRLAQIAHRRPDLLTSLALDLDVPATLERVIAEVEDRAATLLDRRLERDLDLGYDDDLTTADPTPTTTTR